MADANSAFTLDDLPLLRRLDRFHLMMIEQPLAHDDIVDHAILQRELQTPICLDESICSAEDVRKAVEMGSCRIINVKLGRVGGYREAIKINDYCTKNGVPVWCGGMLESGIGRAHNIALSTLSGFILPGDVSASKRYYAEETISPPVEVTPSGTIQVSERPGVGYDLNWKVIEKATVRTRDFH
jgi:O-succinylbenzoate synthase